MWNPFKNSPACPVEDEGRAWVDGRFAWLREKLGDDRMLKATVVLPTPEFFPDPYEGRPDDVQAMLVRVAGFMHVDPARLQLFLYDEGDPLRGSALGHHQTSGSAGLYVGGDVIADGVARIGIETSRLKEPMSLVATLAHEIGHEILLGGGLVARDEEDHEPLTDLIVVYLGLGIFSANSTISDRGFSTALTTGWRTSRLGYLNQRMFGYALARFAAARGETSPAWLKHVRPDVRAPLKQGLKYIEAHG